MGMSLSLGLDIGSPLVGKWGGGTSADYLAQWISASTYADWNAKAPGVLFTTSLETTPAVANGDKVGSWRSTVGGYTALQATAAQRLNLLIASTRYTLTGDGTDDNLLTTWLAASGGNTIFFDVDVPVAMSAVQSIFGGLNSVPVTARLRVSFDTSGRLCAGVGSQNETVIVGTSDFRGQRCVGALSQNGSVVSLFSTAKGAAEYAGAQVGSIDTTVPALIAGMNNVGTPTQFFAGGIARIIPVQKGGLTISDWQNIGPQLAAQGA